MDYLFQKVSYLQGLADGLEIDESTNEGKLLVQIIDALGDFAEVLDEIVEDQVDLEDYVTFIDEDLADLEDVVYDYDEDFILYDDFDELDEFDLDCNEDCCGEEDCQCHDEDED